MIEIKDLGFGTIEIFDKDTQYAPTQSIKIGNNTYIREDLINKSDLQHRLKVAEKAFDNLYGKFEVVAFKYAKMDTIPSKLHFKEQAESELKGE